MYFLKKAQNSKKEKTNSLCCTLFYTQQPLYSAKNYNLEKKKILYLFNMLLKGTYYAHFLLGCTFFITELF